jgi:restriction endonuclease Mrr
LPDEQSDAAKVLNQLVSLKPAVFEGAVVSLFEQVDVVHLVTQTRLTADGGFDFEGSFKLPPPLEYSIDFRGEVKRYARRSGVRPKDVSRLVARLGRGQYGLFVTTSFFTSQAQAEVLEDRYPARLFAGSDVVRFMRELRIVSKDQISPKWLAAVEDKARTS